MFLYVTNVEAKIVDFMFDRGVSRKLKVDYSDKARLFADYPTSFPYELISFVE